MDSVLAAKIKDISELYGIPMRTVVNHWFVWCGNDASGRAEFAAQAEIEASHGMSMDINYAHYDNNSSQKHFLGPSGSDQGNFTGSGIPMKFALSTGKTLDIYQHLNNVYDQQYNENHDPEGFFNCFKGLMDRSLQDEAYSYISIKSHNDEYYFSKAPLMKMLSYAKKHNIPVWSASKLLDFIKMRDEAGFSEMNWTNRKFSFNLNSSVINENDLTFMIPFRRADLNIEQIKIDGKARPLIIRNIDGLEYALCTTVPGKNYQIEVFYGK